MDSTQGNTHQDSNNLLSDQDLEDVEIVREIEEEENLREQATENAQSQKKRRIDEARESRSIHWNDYTKVWVEVGNPPIKKLKGKCKRCGALIAADTRGCGTNGLRNHTVTCLKRLSKSQPGNNQTVLNYSVDRTGGNASLTAWKFDQKAVRQALCEMIILDELPFTFVEHEGFKRFVHSICPQFQIPSRQTIRTDCVKLFLERKQNLNKFFKKEGMGRVSITSDCWTAVNNTSFICVTAHCIGKDWKLHKKIISFSKIESHRGSDIGEAIVASLEDWGLRNLFACTVDNASANDGAIRHVISHLDTLKKNVLDGKYFHMRCVAHILNLVVQDGLEEIGISIRRVREAVKWLKSSPQRDAHWDRVVNMLADRIHCKKSLCLDVPTRWNSTYMMLEAALPYQEAFKVYGQMYPSFDEDLSQKKHNNLFIGLLQDEDWVNVKKMMDYLKKFYELTLLVSATKYPTSHLFFAEICDIFDLISELEISDDREVSSMATKMRLKIGKYWMEERELNPKLNRILYIAAVLDPRQKLKHVETCFKSVYGAGRGADMVKEVKESMDDLFEFYRAQKTPPTLPRTSDTSTTAPRMHGRSDRRGSLSLMALQASDDEDTSNANELAVYLTESKHKMSKGEEVDNFDILKWWSENPRYHILSEMARDILAIPISSVASESAFSTGGRVLTAYRSSLTCNMVEALICAGDWLKTSTSVEKKDEEGMPEEEQHKEFQNVLATIERITESSTAQSQSGPQTPHL